MRGVSRHPPSGADSKAKKVGSIVVELAAVEVWVLWPSMSHGDYDSLL